MMDPPSNGVASDGESVEMGLHGNESAKKNVEFADNIESGNCDQDNGSKGHVTAISFYDHYSLQYPSSTVRFRTSVAAHRIYEGNRTQFVLEERDDKVIVKRVRDTTSGVYVLRGIYTITAIVWSGFLFIFCTQLLIFLVMNLAVYTGATTGSELAVGRAVGTLLSFPLFIHGLASALIIDGQFVADTWAGGYLVKTLVFGGLGSVFTAWMTFGFYFGFPLLVMCICLLAGIENFWAITALFWFSSVGVFYILFVGIIVYFEIKACLEIVANEYNIKGKTWQILKRAILTRQTSTYSGYKRRVFVARGSLREISVVRESLVSETDLYRQGLYSRFTKWPFLEKNGLIERLPEPGQLLHPVEEASGVRPFITHNTWSLEKLYCRPRNSWYIAVVEGPAALTRAQLRSSFVCAILGNLLICLIVISILVWYGATGVVVTVVIFLMGVGCFPSFVSTVRTFNMARDLSGLHASSSTPEQAESNLPRDTDRIDEEENEIAGNDDSEHGLSGTSDSEGVFQVCVTYRTTRATDLYCWIMFVAEITLWFLFPLISLYLTNDAGIGSIFLVLGVFSLLRYYMNVGAILEEVGNLQALQGKNNHKKWQNRSRTIDIVSNVTRSRTRGPWIVVLGFFFFLCLALVISGWTQGDSGGESSAGVTLAPGFSYIREEHSLPYPTCSLDFNSVGQGGIISTVDFAFMASMAYETNSTKVQEYYNAWFGPGVANDMPEVVEAFRSDTDRETSPVTYKLASFANISSTGQPFGLVSIRGSYSSWDWLTNAQLWSAAFGMQILQSFLPFGFVWRPIMDELVKAISIVESESIKRVSYYVETTDFVLWLQQNGTYAGIKVTGHSLGGGIALITGAQTGVSGIGISAPNAMLLRKALDPPVSEESLNTLTFNIIPENDFVPRVGGVAQLYQNIDCTAPDNKLFGCHTSWRTLCELLYKCGSGDRPVLCECISEFGYPEPVSSNGESFAQACSI